MQLYLVYSRKTSKIGTVPCNNFGEGLAVRDFHLAGLQEWKFVLKWSCFGCLGNFRGDLSSTSPLLGW